MGFECLGFLYYLTSLIWWYKLPIFKLKPSLFTVNHLTSNFSENVDISKPKFKWVSYLTLCTKDNNLTIMVMEDMEGFNIAIYISSSIFIVYEIGL